MTPLPVPPVARRRAKALGADGIEWLASLGATLEQLVDAWELVVDGVLPGASAAVVLAVRASGEAAVLKLEVPDPDTAGQGPLLERAAGKGYARLLARDPERRALLLERLGDPLGRRRLPVEQELVVLADLARQGWLEPDGEAGGSASKARGLARFVEDAADGWRGSVAVDAALRFADRRGQAVVPERVVHGDPHPGNALAVPSRRPGDVHGYVWIDPDGFVADPAYDIGVVLRERGTLDPVPTATLRTWCALLADRAGVDAQAVWEWSLIERVSTGLLLVRLGEEDTGRRWLASAEGLLA